MGKSKKHHYLPRAAYLSHFQREDQEGGIYQYMRNRDVLPVNLLDAGAQNHLYTTTIEDEKNYDIEEKCFAPLDETITPLLRTLNSETAYAVLNQPIIILTREQRQLLSVYIAFQYTRTPAFIAQQEQAYCETIKALNQKISMYKEGFHAEMKKLIAEGLIEKLSDEEIEVHRQWTIEGNYNITASGKNYFLGMMLDLGKHVIPAVDMKAVTILRVGGNSNLITSDHPLIKYPDMSLHPMHRGGFISSRLFLPIGKKTALLLYNDDEYMKYKLINDIERVGILFIGDDAVENFNRDTINHAENYLFSGHHIKRIAQLFAKTKKPKRFQIG